MKRGDLGSVSPTSLRRLKRRRWARIPYGLASRGNLVADLGDRSLPVKVRNLCAGGVGLISPQRIDADGVRTLRLFNKVGRFTLAVGIRVIYGLEHPSGDFLMGAAFTRELTDEEIRALFKA